MINWLQKCAEYVFPERPEHKLLRCTSIENFLRHLNPATHGDFVSLMDFREPIVKAAIHEAKFSSNERAWQLLGAALAQYLKHQPTNTLIVPIPLSRKRYRQRKYNQVHEVVKRALKDTNAQHLKLGHGLIYRCRDTKPQTSLNKKERLTNVKDAFRAEPTSMVLVQTRLVIVDDVVTTGATLKEAGSAAAELKPLSITLVSLSH